MRRIENSAPGIRPSAFTLVEVLVALVILALGIVSLLQLQLLSIRNADRAFRQSQAVLLADRMMAETLNAGYPNSGTTDGTVESDDSGEPLTWNVTVADLTTADLQGAALAGLRSVKVEVTWLDGQDTRTIQLVNYVAQGSQNAQPAP